MARIVKDPLLNDIVNVALGITGGFFLFWVTSHQKSPLHQKLPTKKIKNVSFLPHIKISRKEKDLHLHHWFNMGAIYMLLYWKKRHILGNKLLHGFLVGSILQGLSYEDRFSFIKPQDKLQLINE